MDTGLRLLRKIELDHEFRLVVYRRTEAGVKRQPLKSLSSRERLALALLLMAAFKYYIRGSILIVDEGLLRLDETRRKRLLDYVKGLAG